MQPNPMAQPYLKVLVTGDRHWKDYQLIEDQFIALMSEFGRPLMVIHGAAMGADSLAARAAFNLRLASHAYPADWDREHRAAGPLRNQRMIDSNKDIALCLVVHDNLATSRGTADCLRRVQKAGIPVRYISH